MMNHRFLFVCGLHRSGTTLLNKCIADHPEISTFRNTEAPADEGQHLQSVYETDEAYGGPGVFGLKKASFLDENSDLVSIESAVRLFKEWSKYWDLSKPILAEKSPPNLVRTRFLQALFPNSYFVVVTRHPVASSYATRKWTDAKPHTLINNWVKCHERFESDKPFLEKCIVVKYEDFVNNPNEILGHVWGELQLNPITTSISIREGVNDKYLERWGHLVHHPSSWIRRVYARSVICKFEKRVNRFGYSLNV
jgi:hypothetical protein